MGDVTKLFINNVKINNFKGIRKLDWNIGRRVICLIGPGDSTKSTILDAIEYALWPSWNLIVTDTDFHNCDLSNPIIIEVTISELPREFISEEKFGLFLRGDINGENDEPVDGQDSALTIRLTIDDTLEPEWSIITNRNLRKIISYKDRAKLNVSRAGNYTDKDFNWGKNSVLQRLADSKVEFGNELLNISRRIRTEFSGDSNEVVDDVICNIADVAKDYGVLRRCDFRTGVDTKMLNSGVSLFALHDGAIPMRSFGLGTRRLISMGLHVNCSNYGSILLVDEVENGLEPYRLRNLLRKLKMQVEKIGQVFLTSHSAVTIVELTNLDLTIIRSENGETKCYDVTEELQGTVRSAPEALLSKKVLVCEGKTEYGIIRALDHNWLQSEKGPSAYYGVSFVEGGGDNSFVIAKHLENLGYDVALFVDSDKHQKTSCVIKELLLQGVKIFQWTESVSTDQRVFLDMPLDSIADLINIAIKSKGEQSVESTIKSEFKNLNFNNIEELIKLTDQKKLRTKLGHLAKKHGWFKRVDFGEELGNLIIKNWNPLRLDEDLYQILDGIEKWVYED